MTFWPFNILKSHKSKRDQDLANIAWKAAHARYMSAVDRGDDRGAGEAWGALYRAQTERLRMELGR